MGVKLGRLSLGFLNSVALRAFMHWVWADRCAEGVGSDDSLYWLAMCPLTLPSASRRCYGKSGLVSGTLLVCFISIRSEP
jgi:hypothetical protein